MSAQQLSQPEQDKLVSLLKKLQPGFQPLAVFMELARLNVLSIIEWVPLRKNGDAIEVLLLPRAQNDSLWPGRLHVPGTVIRPAEDQSYEHAFTRILNDELLVTEVSMPHFVSNVLHQSKRGTENAQVFWVEVTGQPRIGSFYDVDDLPNSVIESQIGFIDQAAKHFKEFRS